MDRMNAILRLEVFAAFLLALALSVVLPPAQALAQDAARGKELFALCAQCHGEHAEGSSETLAPAIGGRPPWLLTWPLPKFPACCRAAHFDLISCTLMQPVSA